MPLEIDILISFVEKDNIAGWVTQFKLYLESMIHHILGVKITIAFKSENDDFDSESVNKVGILIVILSKNYIKSGKCLTILKSFHSNNSKSKSKVSRIFKVLKYSLPSKEHPPLLRKLVNYEMFKFDFETNMASEYNDFFSEEANNYWMRMADLTYDLSESLSVLKIINNVTVKYILNQKTIYLTETGHDLSIQRNIIRRELQRFGCTVLPNILLPNDVAKINEMVYSDLENCCLSIHLIGNTYGEIPDDSTQSVAEIQNRICAKYASERNSSKSEFSRLIWITPNLNNVSDIQNKFIDTLRRNLELQEGAEILQTPLEDFKNIMREELLSDSTRHNLSNFYDKTIYLVHDKIDQQEAVPLINLIRKFGFKVLLPAFEGNLVEVRKKHIENLKTLDGAIILKGKVNDNWVRMKVLDLLKAPGFGRAKKIQGKAILSNSSLDQYKNQNLTLINGKSIDAENSIKKFLHELNSLTAE